MGYRKGRAIRSRDGRRRSHFSPRPARAPASASGGERGHRGWTCRRARLCEGPAASWRGTPRPSASSLPPSSPRARSGDHGGGPMAGGHALSSHCRSCPPVTLGGLPSLWVASRHSGWWGSSCGVCDGGVAAEKPPPVRQSFDPSVVSARRGRRAVELASTSWRLRAGAYELASSPPPRRTSRARRGGGGARRSGAACPAPRSVAAGSRRPAVPSRSPAGRPP